MGKQTKEEPLLPGDRYGVLNEPDGEITPAPVDMSSSPQAVAKERARQRMVRRMNKVPSPSSADLIERHSDRYGL